MALFFPTTSATRAYHITAKRLGRMGVKGLILDIDNTLTSHDAPEPDKAILDWLEQMKRDGIRLILLSNNHPPRVQPFADRLGLAFEADGKKPLPAGYRRAARTEDPHQGQSRLLVGRHRPGAARAAPGHDGHPA